MHPSSRDSASVRWRPVPALRYRVDDGELAHVTIAPPDHWDDEQVSSFERRDPHNVVRLLAPVLAGDGDADRSQEVAARLRSWISDGVMGVDSQPAVYVYRCSTEQHALTGVVAAMACHPDADGRLLPHENLIPRIVERQSRLLHTTSAQLEPVVAVHRATAQWNSVVEQVTSEPAQVTTVTEDDVRHQVWVCAEQSVADMLARQVEDSRALIADGHHRWAALQSLAAAGGARDALVMLVDVESGGLQLGPIHRVLRTLTWERVRQSDLRHGRLADEREARSVLDSDPQACVLTDGVHWLVVTPPGGERAAAVEGGANSTPKGAHELAVTRLHVTWVPQWGVAERDIDYVHDLETARMLVRRDGGVAVLLPAPEMDTVFAAARAGTMLPRKATSFGPKPRIGLLMRLLG